MLVYINYVNAKLCIKYITTYLYYYKYISDILNKILQFTMSNYLHWFG